MGYHRSAEPTREPVELADMKLHLRVDQDAENDYIQSLIMAAREYVENYTRRSLITQTWQLFLDHFPQEFYPIFDGYTWCASRTASARQLRRKNTIYLAYGNVQSITSIQYTDETGVLQTLSSGQYQLSTTGQEARLYPQALQPWPATLADELDAVSITFIAGYGDAPDVVPATIKHAIKLLVGTWYQNRESSMVGGNSTDLPRNSTVDAMLATHRLFSFK